MDSFKEKISSIVDFVKRHWVWLLIGFIVALILIGYGAGWLTQMQVYGNENAITGETKTADLNFFKNLRIAFFTPPGQKTLGSILLIVAVVVIAVIAMRKLENKGEMDPDRNFEYSKKNTYGTSGWMTKKEMDAALDVKNVNSTYGTILGALNNNVVSVVPTIRKDSKIKYTEAERQKSMRTNKHVCVLGASGSMKSRAYVRPAIFQCAKRGESLIITDPKGEMYEDTAEMLRAEGYNVKVFNLKDQIYSDSWDCLAEVTDEVMAQVFCSVIIQNTGGAKGDHFWDNAEMNILKALVLYVTIENKKNDKPVTMAEVYRLLTTQKVADLEMMFKVLPQTHPAFVPYSIYAQAGESVRGNIVIGLASRIQVFQSQVTKNITSYPEIDLTLPGKEKCAYFCAISDQDATFTFLSSLFFAFLFIKLVKYADNYGKIPGKLDVPVNFILDEFSNIGQIPDFEKKISTVRSRDINISVIIQNIPQLKSRYPNDVWQEIIGNCDTQLFLGCTDETTAKYISDRSGVATIDIQSEQTVRKTMAVAQFIPDYKKTDSVGKRNVMTQDEVLRLPGRQALVIIRGEKLLKVDKFDFTRHPWSKKLKPCRMSERIPRWHRREMEAEAAGYRLCTESPRGSGSNSSGGGNLYYLDPHTGKYYERTAFINANDGDVIPETIIKGKPVYVAIEKTSGYQITMTEDGQALVINVQTGETMPFYGFNARGELLDRPLSSIDEADEMIGAVEADESIDENVQEPEREEPSGGILGPAAQRFDALIHSVARRRGSAKLDESMLTPVTPAGKKTAPKPSVPVPSESVAKLPVPDIPAVEQEDNNPPMEPSFDKAPQRVGSSQVVPERIFDEPEDTLPDTDDVWAGLREELHLTPPQRDIKPEENFVAEPPVDKHSAVSQPKPASSGTDTEHGSGRKESVAKPKPTPSPQQKQKQSAGQKPKQNADFFSLTPPPPKKKKSKPAAPEIIPQQEVVETPIAPTVEDDLFVSAPTHEELDTPPVTPEAYVPDYVSDPKPTEVAEKQDEPVDTIPSPLPESDEEIDISDTAMSAADVMGQLHMAKTSAMGKKKKPRSDVHDRDKAESDRAVAEAEYGTHDRDSDWGYAFVNGDDLFD